MFEAYNRLSKSTMAKIYLSSTYEDLKEYRDVVYRALRQMQHDVIAMEDYVAADARPLEKCLRDVEECDLYIGIIGWRYGYVPERQEEGGKSITEFEFRHAVKKNKSCLLFLTAKDYPWLPEHIDRGVEGERLQAFRSELISQHVISFFGSKENLARLAGAAVHNWDKEKLTQLAISPPAQKSESNLGNFVFKTCNRSRQVFEFMNFFTLHLKQSTGIPQVYFIHGQEKECHDSLVERLVHTQVKPLSEKKWGEQFGVITFKRLGWSYDGELADIQQDLKRALFMEFDPTYSEDDLSAAALEELFMRSLNRLIIIYYTIHVVHWNDVLKESIRWYLTYLAAIKGRSSSPQVLVFFSFVYPEAKTSSRWKKWLGFNRFTKVSIEGELDLIISSNDLLPCLKLRELLPVRRDDVKDWFSFNNIHLEKRRYELLEKMFEGEDGKTVEFKSMADIEAELLNIMKNVQQEVMRARGYYE
jgi:hypothetical protein